MSDSIYGLPYEDTRLCDGCGTLHEWGELNKDKLCEKCEFKQLAKEFGQKAHKDGLPVSPHLNIEFSKWMPNSNDFISLYKEYIKGWTIENLASA